MHRPDDFTGLRAVCRGAEGFDAGGWFVPYVHDEEFGEVVTVKGG